jgi:hypothetical protein
MKFTTAAVVVGRKLKDGKGFMPAVDLPAGRTGFLGLLPAQRIHAHAMHAWNKWARKHAERKRRSRLNKSIGSTRPVFLWRPAVG